MSGGILGGGDSRAPLCACRCARVCKDCVRLRASASSRSPLDSGGAFSPSPAVPHHSWLFCICLHSLTVWPRELRASSVLPTFQSRKCSQVHCAGGDRLGLLVWRAWALHDSENPRDGEGSESECWNQPFGNAQGRSGCGHCVERSVSPVLPNSKLRPEGGQLLPVARPRLRAREAGGVSIWGTQGGTVPPKFWQRRTIFCSDTILDRGRRVLDLREPW